MFGPLEWRPTTSGTGVSGVFLFGALGEMFGQDCGKDHRTHRSEKSTFNSVRGAPPSSVSQNQFEMCKRLLRHPAKIFEKQPPPKEGEGGVRKRENNDQGFARSARPATMSELHFEKE
jgi:hypothetical protein